MSIRNIIDKITGRAVKEQAPDPIQIAELARQQASDIAINLAEDSPTMVMRHQARIARLKQTLRERRAARTLTPELERSYMEEIGRREAALRNIAANRR